MRLTTVWIPEILRIRKPLLPILAGAINLVQPPRVACQLLQYSVLSLENLDDETGRGVPCDMAMKSPSTGIISFESDDDEAGMRQ